MKKVTVIVGEECSGKSRLAMELVKEFDPSEILIIDGRDLNDSEKSKNVVLQNISKKTKVIISDDTSLDSIPFLLFEVMFCQSVNTQMKKLSPYGEIEKLIIVCDIKISKNHFPQEFSASSSVEIIDTKDYYKEKL